MTKITHLLNIFFNDLPAVAVFRDVPTIQKHYTSFFSFFTQHRDVFRRIVFYCEIQILIRCGFPFQRLAESFFLPQKCWQMLVSCFAPRIAIVDFDLCEHLSEEFIAIFFDNFF